MRPALVTAVSAVTVAVLGLGGAIALAPSASAADDISGSWNAVSRKGGDPGYSMKITAADADPGNAYSGVLRFHYQDGKVGPKIKAGLLTNGSKVWLLLNGQGGFADASNPNIMKGTIGQDGSLYFPTCYKKLKFVTKKNAPESCLFQEFPVS